MLTLPSHANGKLLDIAFGAAGRGQIGGVLRVGREDDGQGTRFTVLFPLVPVTGGTKS